MVTSPEPEAVAIGDRLIGRGHPCLVVAEVAQTHDGSLGTAHAYIDAVARAGAGAIKFQTHIAAAESTPAEPWRVKFSRQDETRYDYWRRMEFTEPQWRDLASHAAERGLLFLSSPFSIQAVELLERIPVPAWKVGSGEVTNVPMLERMARTGRPVILSSGMSSWEELEAAVKTVQQAGAPVVVLQCTSGYPCPPERTGLEVIPELARRLGVPAGFSDHSGTIFAGLAAVTLGACLLEVHVTLSRECFGPDVSSSVTTAELAELARGVRFIEQALAHPMDKDQNAAAMAEMRKTFGKSIVAARDLPAGRVLAEDDLTLKKPGNGIAPGRWREIVGRRLTRAIAADSTVREDDLE
jgi:N,N'-diacetyllegionaminate synthase